MYEGISKDSLSMTKDLYLCDRLLTNTIDQCNSVNVYKMTYISQISQQEGTHVVGPRKIMAWDTLESTRLTTLDRHLVAG